MEQAKSFSSKVICGNVNRELLFKRDNKGETVKGDDGKVMMLPLLDLYTVYGVVTGSKIKPTRFGDNTELHGEFRAINSETGEEFATNKYYPPEILTLALVPKIGSAPASGFEFGVVVGIKPAPATSIGYTYYIRELTKIAESDAVQGVFNKIKATLPIIRKQSKK